MIAAPGDETISRSVDTGTGSLPHRKPFVAEVGFKNNPYLDAARGLANTEGAEVVVVCAAIEAEIAQREDRDRQEFLAELGIAEPGRAGVIRAGYRLLNRETFFTVGPKEVRTWTTNAGAKAPVAAGEIRTDFQHGFIRAEGVSCCQCRRPLSPFCRDKMSPDCRLMMTADGRSVQAASS